MSVTKILLRHNRTGAGTLPGPESASCCEPLLFKNKLYIRSQNAEELVNPEDYNDESEWADAVEQYRAAHPAGTPIFIGPYEHPLRDLNTLGTNVQESYSQSSTVSSITSQDTTNTPGTEFDSGITYNTINAVRVIRSTGHIVTADAQFSIQVTGGTGPSNNPYIGRWWQWDKGYGNNMNILKISSPSHSTLLTLRNTGFGYISCIGTLGDYDWSESQDQYTVETGDCLVVTDANWASNPNSPSYNSDPSKIDHDYDHMIVRSRLSFDTTQTNKYLCQNGTWKTPSGLNVAAAPGDTSVKGVITGEVSIDGVPTEFTVQPANSYLGGKSGAYYYTGQGVVRPLGTTTGIQTENKRKLLYTSEDTTILNCLCPTILRQPVSTTPGTEEPQKAKWVAIPVFVDYHKVDGTDRVEAVPYIMLPETLLRGVLEYWQERTQSSVETEGTQPPGENTIVDDNNTVE